MFESKNCKSSETNRESEVETAAKIETELRGELLILRIKGRVGFQEPDFQMQDDLIALLRNHISGGACYVLIDYSKTHFVYPSSIELGAVPFFRKDIIGESRVAACFNKNLKARGHARRWTIERFLTCFDTEAEAINFLYSDAPMTNPARVAHEFWASIPEGKGPETCKQEGCNRLRVRLSVFCKRHHYEAVMGAPYISDTDV